MYAAGQRRVDELEALGRLSEAVSDSLYLEESLAAIVRTTMDALGATGAALVLDDGEIAWPEGRAGAYAERVPLRWRGGPRRPLRRRCAAPLARSPDGRAGVRPRRAVLGRRPAAACLDRASRGG